MRSQASKPSPKKGDLSKTSFKSSTTKQATKKAVSPKKVKNLVNKSLIKNPKKSSSKDDLSNIKNEEDAATSDKNQSQTDPKSGACKPSTSRGDSPTKKPKKDPKEKKDTLKSTVDNTKKVIAKKADKKPKPVKANVKKCGKGAKKDIKYKINKEVIKKATPKFSKAKTIIKKGNAVNNDKKKGAAQAKPDTTEKEQEVDGNKNDSTDSNEKGTNKATEGSEDNIKNKIAGDEKTDDKTDPKKSPETAICKTPPKSSSTNQPETPKTETERPPKFFTSTRSPRMVDIDVKCCKNSKGNLSVSERFVSMKLDAKEADNAKDKNSSNTLVSQGPEIDVYTFTEKVDSPKSILSDFRSPINKNIGRVRPIARVKGTVIDKKTESEKKKYSPHRPIEEVVKQLKNKRSEELNANQSQSVCTASNVPTTAVDNGAEIEEKPKPIVSKSYKMVARKSSITGKPFSPIKFLDQETPASKTEKTDKSAKPTPTVKKTPAKPKKQTKKSSLSDEDIDNSKFALNTKTFHYTSSDDSVSESNDDNDTKESSESDNPKNKKAKNKKLKKNRITDGAKKPPSKELKELSKDSLIDLKESSALLGNEKPSKRRLKLLSMWTGPKKHRMASLNAIAKVHCLYENESRTHMELGLMKTIDRQVLPSTSKTVTPKKKDNKPKETEKQESTSESEYEAKREKKEDSSESSDDNPPQRSLRGVPGIRSAGKYWDPKSSTSSSEDSEQDTKKKATSSEKKKASPKASSSKSDSDKPPAKMKKTAGVPVKKKRNRNEVVMDLKDMVVQKRMASLNATAILAASYEKRSPKSNKDDTTSDSCSDESYSQKSKNGVSSGVKSESKNEYEPKSESDESTVSDRKQKVEVIVNQDTDVTITGVYSTHHHEGFCTVSGMQYRISSTSHTQTTATANCEKEGCSREDGARYTPLSALSSMQPPAEHSHPHPVPELGGLARRPGCSSAFSAPSTASHHEQG
uniref:Uncharacterized protein n=1 Tax=Heliothis virescens TaxID=7102 RepID=A0A2A4JHM2_HELVI